MEKSTNQEIQRIAQLMLNDHQQLLQQLQNISNTMTGMNNQSAMDSGMSDMNRNSSADSGMNNMAI